MGNGDGGSPSSPIPNRVVQDLLDPHPPTLVEDFVSDPPPVETPLSGGGRVRSGFAPNGSSARLWFNAGSQPLNVTELEVTNGLGRTYHLDGVSLAAGASKHLSVATDGYSAITTVTVHTPEGETEIHITPR
jgi:hypothetical protein